MKPKDRVLSVGRKLDKKGLASFKMATPSGHPAYYRSNGLQIIPSEVEEIDTNGRCLIIITPEAASLSGLVMTLLQILGQGEAGPRRAFAAVTQFKTLLAGKRLGGWELSAAKDIVTASLSLADKAFPSPVDERGCGEIEDNGDNIMRQHMHRRKIRDWQRDFSEASYHRAFDHAFIDNLSKPLDGSSATSPNKSNGDWITIRGIIGLELSQHWIPVTFPSNKITHKEKLSILRAITRRGLKPEIAMTIIANRPKGVKRPS
jgi:hypothetical protein